MKILGSVGNEEIATVYIAENETGRLLEFAESVQPPIPLEDKWVLLVSSLYGCPVGCKFCDAGEFYRGKLTAEEIFAQIDYMVKRRFPQRKIPVKKFKIQFARMGEPALNPNALEVLERLPRRYDAPGLLPTLSTVAPLGTDGFFQGLLEIKKEMYPLNFQLQFSVHSTDARARDELIPVKKWDLAKIAEYGGDFFDAGGRKITLNFALAEGAPLDCDLLREMFSVDKFLVKFTPVNPTVRAYSNRIDSRISPHNADYDFIGRLRDLGYEVILSIGELEENKIGSNCGQYIGAYLRSGKTLSEGYEYQVEWDSLIGD